MDDRIDMLTGIMDGDEYELLLQDKDFWKLIDELTSDTSDEEGASLSSMFDEEE